MVSGAHNKYLSDFLRSSDHQITGIEFGINELGSPGFVDALSFRVVIENLLFVVCNNLMQKKPFLLCRPSNISDLTKCLCLNWYRIQFSPFRIIPIACKHLPTVDLPTFNVVNKSWNGWVGSSLGKSNSCSSWNPFSASFYFYHSCGSLELDFTYSITVNCNQ